MDSHDNQEKIVREEKEEGEFIEEDAARLSPDYSQPGIEMLRAAKLGMSSNLAESAKTILGNASTFEDSSPGAGSLPPGTTRPGNSSSDRNMDSSTSRNLESKPQSGAFHESLKKVENQLPGIRQIIEMMQKPQSELATFLREKEGMLRPKQLEVEPHPIRDAGWLNRNTGSGLPMPRESESVLPKCGTIVPPVEKGSDSPTQRDEREKGTKEKFEPKPIDTSPWKPSLPPELRKYLIK